MFRSSHRLLVQRLDVGAPQLVEVEVALQGGWQQRGLLGVEGVLWYRAGGGGGGRSQVERVAMGLSVGGASVLLLQVEVTQADRQAGVISLPSQRGGAHCGEGAWAQAVGRNNLTVWRGSREKREWGGEGERKKGQQLIVVLLCFALISNLLEASGDEVFSQRNPNC